MPTKIQAIQARRILGAHGEATLEVDVLLEGGVVGRAAVTAAESAALGHRDLPAVGRINHEMAERLVGMDAADQAALDEAMIDADGTADKSRFGPDATLGVSIAAARAASVAAGEPLYEYLGGTEAVTLPVPTIHLLHPGGAVDFRAFLVQPWGAPSFSAALRMGIDVFDALGTVLQEKGYGAPVGDDGAWAPSLRANHEAPELILQAIERAGFRPGEEIWLALAPAAGDLARQARHRGREGYCFFRSDPDRVATAEEMVDLWAGWVEKYPIRSIEDGLAGDDWAGWKTLTDRLGRRVQLLGDELFAGNARLLQRGIDEGCANGAVIHPGQIGTLTETLSAIDLVMGCGRAAVLTDGPGEPEDTTLADLTVARNTGQIKAGGADRSGRVGTVNQLLRIEEALGNRAVYGASTWNKG